MVCEKSEHSSWRLQEVGVPQFFKWWLFFNMELKIKIHKTNFNSPSQRNSRFSTWNLYLVSLEKYNSFKRKINIQIGSVVFEQSVNIRYKTNALKISSYLESQLNTKLKVGKMYSKNRNYVKDTNCNLTITLLTY